MACSAPLRPRLIGRVGGGMICCGQYPLSSSQVDAAAAVPTTGDSQGSARARNCRSCVPEEPETSSRRAVGKWGEGA